jgi:hypothetical protein
MPLCPQITNTPITVTQTVDFTVSSVVPAVADTKDGLATDFADIVVSLDGKTKAYYQTSAPTGPDLNEGDIWFDTDDGNKQYYYNGTAWVSVQDTAIAAAQAAATAAQTTADGKNRIYRQATTPTGTFAVGDLWFNTGSDNQMSRWDGSTWVSTTLGTNALANFSANKITSGTIDASVVNVSNINAGNISVGTLSADRIASASITGTKIAAGTITASNIATNTITATQIASGTITASQIASSTITSTQIAAGTITASNIASGTITATQIAAGTITTDKLVAGTLTGYTIQSVGAAFTISSTGSISGADTIGCNSLTATGTVAGTTLSATGAMSANSLNISSTTTFNGANNSFPNITQSTSAANLRWGTTTSGRIFESTASSARFKTDIVDLLSVDELNPKKLLQLPVHAFRYRDDYLGEEDERSGLLVPGFIAEEVDQIYPIAADYELGQPNNWNDKFMVPAMLALIQDLYKEIALLKGE